MRNGSLWSDLVFEKKGNFPRIWLRDLMFIIWGPEIKHLKAHNFVWRGCFFFHSSIATSTTNWVQIFTGLLFYAYVEIHQVRRLVFDIYQQCPVSLNMFPKILKTHVTNSLQLAPITVIISFSLLGMAEFPIYLFISQRA